MSIEFQIPRNCLAALLIAQFAVLGPHLFRLPLWVAAVAIVCALWRLLLYTGRGFYPSAVLKALLVVVSLVAILRDYGSLFALEPIVALLITTFALKLIEMKSRRDVLVVIFLAYFVAATHFLFEQGIFDAMYVLLAAALVTGALVALHEGAVAHRPTHAVSTSFKLLFQAIPLTIIMFIVFPRIDPLWSVPGTESSAKTGPSDSMSPGDISKLAGSSDLAFRVTFEGDVPPPQDLYWRGLVFNHFDGRQWRAAERKDARINWGDYLESISVEPSTLSRPVKYTVVMEPSRQSWLYAMPLARTKTKSVLQGQNFTLRTVYPLDQRFQYQVTSWQDYRLEGRLRDTRRQQALQLPRGFNPKAREFAQQLRVRSGDDQAFVNAVLRHFNSEEFVYTIQPPKLGTHSVDEFLFGARRGFCEHYASSFVFLMRAAGVPARVVAGYQGGELNPFDNYLLIHEYDAHAWAEVWYPNKGWTRVDPTAAVAPERVESSVNDVLGDEMSQAAINPFLNLRQIPALRWLRLRWDTVNYSWTKWVLNYDTELQMELLENWLGGVSAWRIGLFVTLGGGLVMLIVALSLLSQRVKHKLHPVDKLYLRSARSLRRLGVERGDAEGVHDFAQRVANAQPKLGDSAKRIAYLYSSLRYDFQAGAKPGPEYKANFRKLREEVKFHLQQASTLQKASHSA